jgi:hypothetical protein
MPPSITLTPKGRQKLENITLAVAQASQEAVKKAMLDARALAAQTAPSPEEEARALSRGTIEGGGAMNVFAGALVGDPDNGRFIRGGEMVSTSEAIAADPIVIDTNKDRVVATTGKASRINAITGFFWATKRRGTQGPSFPFNRALLQAWEYGGMVWNVFPRPENIARMLKPEDDVVAPAMRKTVVPRRMFHRAKLHVLSLRPSMIQHIREAVQKAGRG